MHYKSLLKFQARDIFIICLILFLYLAFTGVLNSTYFAITNRDYYTGLTDALLHGRLNLLSKSKFDLSYYNGKWYAYWGISPVLFVLPFYFIFKSNTSDVLYTLVAGLLNIFLFYLLIKEFTSYLEIKLDNFNAWVLVLAFALASPNLHLTFAAAIWHTNQIIATVFLLIFYILFIHFLRYPHRLFFLIASIIFYNLAWTARYTLIENGILYIGLMFLGYKKIIPLSWQKILLYVAVITFFFIILTGLYNYLRFGSVLETGHTYQRGNSLYVSQKKGESFSLRNALSSLKYYSIIFIQYPFILLSVITFWQSLYIHTKKKQIMFISMFCTIMLNVMFLLTYYFPVVRYIFDFIPLLYLLNSYAVRKISYRIQILFLVLCVSVNLYMLISNFK